MALAAAQIVDALAARLTPMAATGGRVYTSRAWPISEAELPAWRVTAETEEVQAATVDGVNQHLLTVRARLHAAAVADLDDVLHTLGGDGCALLFAPPVPYALQLVGIEREALAEGESALGALTLELQALYFVHPAAPGAML